MHSLGHTRSARRDDHVVHTPDTFVRASWPGMINAVAIVHASPALGAAFTQYTAELAADGYVPATPVQRFVYVLSGEVQVAGASLVRGGFAYVPSGDAGALHAPAGARVAVIEKPYVALPGAAPPTMFTGAEADQPAQALMGDPDLEVRALVPADTAFDFAVNTMAYRPGAALPMVEVHVMEHGLLFLEGGGIYRLGDAWYPVTEGDFIYMAPWCPQWFGALGKVPAKYLIYKDWNRAAS
jgi:(S)-ureidoglycine aminohydrolase